MKTNKLLVLLSIALLLFPSCFFTKKFYQNELVEKDVKVPYEAEITVSKTDVAVFQFTSTDVKDFIFENSDLKVFYEFAGNTEGYLKFKIENKTNKNIFIDLAYSSFINNGRAKNYTDAVDIKGKVLLIPDNSYLEIDKFQGITDANKDKIETLIRETIDIEGKYKTFNKSNSPLIFRNKITYDFQEDMSSPKLIDNTFWVSKLNVYSKEEFELLTTDKVKNMLIYSFNYSTKENVTKYRTEKQQVMENVEKKRKEFSLNHTLALAGGIILTLIILVIVN